MPKLNAVLMAVLAVAVIGATAFLTLRPTPAQALEPAQVQKLLRKLADSDPDIRREGEAGLRRAGTAAVPSLRDASKSPEDVGREYIVSVLEACDWKVKGRGNAADVLKMNPSTLRSRMRKLDLLRPDRS